VRVFGNFGQKRFGEVLGGMEGPIGKGSHLRHRGLESRVGSKFGRPSKPGFRRLKGLPKVEGSTSVGRLKRR